MDTRSSLCWNCLGYRRRNAFSRLTPFVIQILIVVAVWIILKKTHSAPYDKSKERITVRRIKSTDDHGLSLCKNDEYIKGTALHIEDIVSVSNSLNPDEKQKQFFLQADILTLDEEHGIPTLYPVGTPVIIDRLLMEGESIKEDKKKSEFYYDNSIEEKDLDDIIPVPGSKEESDGELQNSSSVNYKNVGTNAVIGETSNKKTDQSVHFESGIKVNNEGFDSNHKVVDNHMSQNINANQFQNSMENARVASLKPNIQSGDNQQSLLGLSDVQEQYQAKPVQQYGMNQNTVVDKPRQPTEDSVMNNFAPVKKAAMMNEAQTNIPQETVFTGGFKERVIRFKTEFYGKLVDGSSDQIPTTYIMNSPGICEELDKVDLLFVIHTIPQNDEQRQRIRETFVKASLYHPFSIAHVFVVGRTPSPNFQGNLDRDQEQYKDIVQGEFIDKPETRTTKGLLSFRWVTTFCSKAQFVLKLDEDVFVDTDKLLHGLIPAVSEIVNKKVMLCFFVQNAPIPRSGPNAFEPNLFPNSSKMRPYCKGFAVLLTVSAIQSLLSVSEHVPVFKFDDLYLYGILPFVAGGIEVYDLGNKRAFHDFGMAVVNCYKDLQEKCPYVATKAFSSRFTSLWEFVKARKMTGFNGGSSLWNIKDYQTSFYS